MITCKNCGNVFDEKYDVCPYCGTAIMHNEAQNPYTYNMPAQMFMSQSSNIAAKKKSNIKLISIISASCLVLIGIIIALIMIFSQPNTQSQLSEQISLGEKYLTEENYEEAIVAFKKAIEIEPNDPELYIKLADAYMANGDSDNAIATLENGYKQTNDEAIKKKLDEFKTQLEYDKLISDGEKAFSDKNYTEAVKKFEKAIELKPTEVKPYISAADCYVNSKDNDSAKKILEKGYEKTKSNDIKKKLDELDKIFEEKIKKEKELTDYKNEFIKAMLNSENEWVNSDNWSSSVYRFIDLDVDGKNELVVSQYSGNAGISTDKVYTLRNNKIEYIGSLGEHGIDSLNLYYNKQSKQYKIFGSSEWHIRGYPIVCCYIENMEFVFNNNIVANLYSSCTYTQDMTDNNSSKYNYKYYNQNTKKEITKSEYEKINNNMIDNCIDTHMKYKDFSYEDYKNFSKSDKKIFLEKSYDSFTYDKH